MKKEDLIKMIQEQVPDGEEVWFYTGIGSGYGTKIAVFPPDGERSFYVIDECF